MLRMESGDETVMSSNWKSSVLIAAGYEPFQLAELAVTAAARLSGRQNAPILRFEDNQSTLWSGQLEEKSSKPIIQEIIPFEACVDQPFPWIICHWNCLQSLNRSCSAGGAKARVDKVPPKILDCFGWCTWDAFYSTISAEGGCPSLLSLKETQYQPLIMIAHSSKCAICQMRLWEYSHGHMFRHSARLAEFERGRRSSQLPHHWRWLADYWPRFCWRQTEHCPFGSQKGGARPLADLNQGASIVITAIPGRSCDISLLNLLQFADPDSVVLIKTEDCSAP